MSKRVVVVASGETERRALPPLVEHLASEGLHVEDIRIPPSHRSIGLMSAEKVIRSAWFERSEEERPDKFVVLVDTDRNPPEDALAPLSSLPERLRDIGVRVCFAYAKPHLEAWFFADAKGLRKYLNRDLGAADPENPKLHLKHLLGSEPYTSRLSGEIASALDAEAIGHGSESFRDFVAALRNGDVRALAF